MNTDHTRGRQEDPGPEGNPGTRHTTDTRQEQEPPLDPRQLGYAVGRGTDAWPTYDAARTRARRALAAAEIIKTQIIYAALHEGRTIRQIADGYDIPKSEVGRIARQVRHHDPSRRAAPTGQAPTDHRVFETVNQAWNGPDADPLPGAPRAVAADTAATLFSRHHADGTHAD